MLRDLVQRSASDWIVGSFGVGAAVLSAGFATYMIAVGPGKMDPKGSGHFGIFAQFDRREQNAGSDPGAMPPPDARFEARQSSVASAAEPANIDFSPTGSIGGEDTAEKPSPRKAQATISDFVLRDVFDGKALVEGRNRISLVSTGTVLDGAGSVLSIRQENGVWVVVTDKGVIRMPGG